MGAMALVEVVGMVEVTVERNYAHDTAAVWAVLADFGNVSWVPGIEEVELEGEGIGMIRHLRVPVYPQLHERLEVLDRDARVLEYSIPRVEYLAVKDYRARAQVIDLGGAGCRVRMSCVATADGAPEKEAGRRTQDFYVAMLGWIDDFLEQSA